MDRFDLMANSQIEGYEEQMRQTERANALQRERLEAERAKALSEAYVSRRITERDMPQRLALYGMTGGLAETSEMDIRNRYGRERGTVEGLYGNRLGELALSEENALGGYRAQIAAAKAEAAALRMAEEARLAEEASRAAASRSTGYRTSGSGYGGLNTPIATAPATSGISYQDARNNLNRILANSGVAQGSKYINELKSMGLLSEADADALQNNVRTAARTGYPTYGDELISKPGYNTVQSSSIFNTQPSTVQVKPVTQQATRQPALVLPTMTSLPSTRQPSAPDFMLTNPTREVRLPSYIERPSIPTTRTETKKSTVLASGRFTR